MALRRLVTVFEDEVEILAGLDVGTLWDRMRGEFLNEYARIQRTGVTADELERELLSFVDGLSPKFEEDLARKSAGVAYNEGRDAEIRTAEATGLVQYVVRSEVLDPNTCPTCQTLDGQVFEVGTPDYERAMPPAGCEGGDRCRGFYVPVPSGIKE